MHTAPQPLRQGCTCCSTEASSSAFALALLGADRSSGTVGKCSTLQVSHTQTCRTVQRCSAPPRGLLMLAETGPEAQPAGKGQYFDLQASNAFANLRTVLRSLTGPPLAYSKAIWWLTGGQRESGYSPLDRWQMVNTLTSRLQVLLQT